MRHPYLTNGAFLNVLMASLLSTMALQLATSTCVIIAGNFISPDAVSVINLTLPLTSYINAVYMLVGMGASYRISRLLGNGNSEGVKSVFSASVIVVVTLGLLMNLFLMVFYPWIASDMTSDERLAGMLREYLFVYAFHPVFFMITLHLATCMKSIGNARLVPQVTLFGTVIQIVTALVSVKLLGMGIRGIALSLCVGLAVQSFLYYWMGIRRSEMLNTITRSFHLLTEMKENARLSMPLFISLVVTGTVYYALNKIIVTALGIEGLNIASVCMQLLLLTNMLMAGINSAMMPIGNMMMGEHDTDGVRLLNASVSKIVLVVFAVVFTLIQLFPSTILNIFGLKDAVIEDEGMYAVRTFAIILPLLAYSMMHMTSLMVLSYTKLASLSAALRTLLMLACVTPIAHVAPQHLWWGFPASVLLNELLLAIISYHIYKRTPGIDPLTLIPETAESTVWSSSLPYNMQSLSETLHGAEEFLKGLHVDGSTVSRLMLTAEELASNIVKYASKGKDNQRFDLLIRVMADKTVISLKDDGIPFNPIREEEHKDVRIEYLDDIVGETIGLRIVNNMGLHLEHRYMYAQNITTFWKEK